MNSYQTICKTSDVPEGTARMFVTGERQVGIFHVDGEFFALDNRCPHASASLAHGIIEDETISCRIHHWRFRLRDGERVDQGCPANNVKCFPVRIVDDEVQVNLDTTE